MTTMEAPAPVLGSLSPSRASDFMSCPLRYRFRVIDQLPERASPEAVRGTVVHAVLERLFELPPAERTPEAAVAMLEPEWARLLAAEPELAELFAPGTGEADRADAGGERGNGEYADAGPTAGGGGGLLEWLESARGLLDGYFALEDPRRLQPAERECRVEVVLPSGLRLRGFVDRLDEAPSGDLRVVDYKTGRVPGEAFEGKALFQLKFYALVLWRTRGQVPRELRLLYLKDRDMLRYAPDERELLAFERVLEALWQAIAKAVASGDFRPRRGPLCEWCDHRSRCPAWGGTPPALPSQSAPV